MSDVTEAGFDRRSLIKKGLVTGGVIATVPIISTFNAPAAAFSPPGFRIRFDIGSSSPWVGCSRRIAPGSVVDTETNPAPPGCGPFDDDLGRGGTRSRHGPHDASAGRTFRSPSARCGDILNGTLIFTLRDHGPCWPGVCRGRAWHHLRRRVDRRRGHHDLVHPRAAQPRPERQLLPRRQLAQQLLERRRGRHRRPPQTWLINGCSRRSPTSSSANSTSCTFSPGRKPV